MNNNNKKKKKKKSIINIYSDDDNNNSISNSGIWIELQFQYWNWIEPYMQWLGSELVTSHYPNQWWPEFCCYMVCHQAPVS